MTEKKYTQIRAVFSVPKEDIALVNGIKALAVKQDRSFSYLILQALRKVFGKGK